MERNSGAIEVSFLWVQDYPGEVLESASVPDASQLDPSALPRMRPVVDAAQPSVIVTECMEALQAFLGSDVFEQFTFRARLEVCPFEAIAMDNTWQGHEHSTYDRRDLHMDIAALLDVSKKGDLPLPFRPLDREELVAFLRPRHRVILSTTRSDGSAQLSPVSGGTDADGRLVIATYPQRAKVRNLRRRAEVSACVLSDEWNGPWVQVDGTAEVLDLPEALDPLVTYFQSIAGEHSNWEEYRAAMVKQGKCLVRLTIERWGPIATGGFPPELAEA